MKKWLAGAVLFCTACSSPAGEPGFELSNADTVLFNSFVDCNMTVAWIGDTFRIFPGKYGEDTLWFETVYQSKTDPSGKTLYAIYHNENYPQNLPYDSNSGQGYINYRWPQGLQGPASPAAVGGIGIMKSTDGGHSWDNKGLFLEDLLARMTLKPFNTSNTFAGGVGAPSAVASGDYLYLFFGEYSYPTGYDSTRYSRQQEWSGQCISVARITLADLDNPQGKAKRWDGGAFTVPWNRAGKPISSLQMPMAEGGSAASSPEGGFYRGPSVSWNEYLQCWVMLMGKETGPSWAGSSIYLSFNQEPDLGKAMASQQWTKPQLLLDRPGYFLWYPSLQPMDDEDAIKHKYTSMRMGKKARLYVKYIKPERSIYASAHIIEFRKK